MLKWRFERAGHRRNLDRWMGQRRLNKHKGRASRLDCHKGKEGFTGRRDQMGKLESK